MDSLVKVVMSLPMTWPVPVLVPVPIALVTGAVTPIAARAFVALAPPEVILRFWLVPVCSVIAPLAAIVGVTPVILPISLNRVPILSVILIWLAERLVAPLTNVIVVLSIVMVSLAANPVVSELLPLVPERAVELEFALPVWLLAAAPALVASTGGAGVPDTRGLPFGVVEKSLGFRPPSAVIVLAAAAALAGVFGSVGKFA